MGAEAAEQLLHRARAGEGRAFGELLEPALTPGFRLAMAMLHDRQAAEDAVQEAAFKAWRKLHLFRTGSDLRPWSLAIVANECRTVRRGRWWSVLRLPELRGAAGGAAEERWAERADLQVALDGLPARHLLPLVLHYGLDLPLAQVAAVLGCTEGAAKLRVHRALKAVRPRMELTVPLEVTP